MRESEIIEEWLSCLSCLDKKEFVVVNENGLYKTKGPERFGDIMIGEEDISSKGKLNVMYACCGLDSVAFKSFRAGLLGNNLEESMNEFYYERGRRRS